MDRMRIIQIAAVAYAANAAYSNSIGDNSFDGVDFQNAPAWQRETNIKGVELVVDNPSVTPRQLHESWMKEKIDQGWTYSAVPKDPEKKTHPCLVDYDHLPPEQRRKDLLFRAVVDAMTKEV